MRSAVWAGQGKAPVLRTTTRETARTPLAPCAAGDTETQPSRKAPETWGKCSKAGAHCAETSPQRPSHSTSSGLPSCSGAQRSRAAQRSETSGDSSATAPESSGASSAFSSAAMSPKGSPSSVSTSNHWLSTVAMEAASSGCTASTSSAGSPVIRGRADAANTASSPRSSKLSDEADEKASAMPDAQGSRGRTGRAAARGCAENSSRA
mmetsp:Transcript_3085/g.6194  ORF Transcript_3085/g.6194 Transcript_3085/m.6194 type:complete len:208 (-) Transcript_3085:7-630(-)